ncbi:MAG TPA: hypothetical protein VKO83_00945 [Steroidobacteraceae bacterium]|nr:hypothetical protein [Steroidobacteraceae bacterium]
MEAVVTQNPSAESRERGFFLVMALAIAITVVTAFSLFYRAGLSSFASPWWVHVHAVTFMAWIGLYVTQNALVARNDIARHRKLGRFAAGWAAWMVVVGLVLTPVNLATHRSPPFFTPPYFLALDWLNILVFAGLIYAAIRNRRRTDWHRRLMLCATICIMAPAWGRLIVLSGHTMTAPLNVALLLVYVAVAMLFDWSNRGRVHVAYLWGGGVLVLWAVATELLSRVPPFAALAARIAA